MKVAQKIAVHKVFLHNRHFVMVSILKAIFRKRDRIPAAVHICAKPELLGKAQFKMPERTVRSGKPEVAAVKCEISR